VFHAIANWILRILFAILLKLDLVGTKHVPREEPFMLMINHVYFLDPFLAVALAPRYTVPMSKIENYKNPLLGLVLRLYGSVSVRRGEVDLQAIRKSLHVLAQGHGLMMAPEGTRSKSRTLLEGHDGMVMLTLHSHVPHLPIVPVAISGQEHLGHNVKRLRRTPVHMVFGQPFYLQPKEGLPHREQMRHMTREAMFRLAALLPPEYRGVYSDLAEATTEYTVTCDAAKG
jgi:1-acyl-sn-glycerol-3-phosphate acyltransferase